MHKKFKPKRCHPERSEGSNKITAWKSARSFGGLRPSQDDNKNWLPARWLLILLLAAIPLFSSACATLGVQPWERDLMAEKAMSVDPNPIQSAFDDHIYFSLEGSSGGRSFAGGGCGCN